ncbi:hypothetical protein PR003_g20552 [Phytophthora rubi]|uniref:Uncharacterized protein n=1 Tax=Phytophthora rubi TaxID=129364 RepID=A0A6A4DPU9_9STRA|nr:hypothetical protein PR001_g28237 [Phytophthora rubi]KAE9309271.1 hypothetical protein PR003_g20552 [Phytophthora rubi]
MGTIVKASGRGLFAVITMFFAKATDCCKTRSSLRNYKCSDQCVATVDSQGQHIISEGTPHFVTISCFCKKHCNNSALCKKPAGAIVPRAIESAGLEVLSTTRGGRSPIYIGGQFKNRGAE